MISRSEAIASVLCLRTCELVVAADGMVSRETFLHDDSEANFYMLGSMGLASSIALGLAVSKPDRRVIVLDGDGNVLMGLGTLAMVGDLLPPNFVHVVLDNEVYGSTGGQRSISDKVHLEKISEAAGYRQTARVETKEALEAELRQMLASDGPSFLLVKVGTQNVPDIPRVSHEPHAIAARFKRVVSSDVSSCALT